MNKKYILHFIIFLTFMLWNESVFSASWVLNQSQTVREMQENIDALEQEKSLLEFKWKNLRVWNSSLWELLRNDLSAEDKSTLLLLVETYNSEKITWEKILKTIIENWWTESLQRKSLLLLKKDFYLSLKPYIAEDKVEKLMTYVESDLTLNEKSKDVDSQIVKIKTDKEIRVQAIQEKIEDNNKVLRKNIENKISTQVKDKLDVFVSSWDFSLLPPEAKIAVFDRVITKLEYESIRLTNLENTTSVIEEKILVFRVMINLLKEYTNSWSI